MRYAKGARRLIRETRLSLEQLIMPYFVREGKSVREEIEAMPGQFRFSIDTLIPELESFYELGGRAILLFGIPSEKDEEGSGAWAKEGIVQRTLYEIKRAIPDLFVITDVCLCAYTSHGHCGKLDSLGHVENDSSLKLLANAALSHAQAGADMIAPSDMLDGRIQAIRQKLDAAGLLKIPILSYSAKYASAFYGPFRDAAHSAPGFGDRKNYQMDTANLKEAMREITLDIKEGADMVMIKPALLYLDVIREAARQFQFPIAAYSVSGEYSMIKAASQKGWLDEKKAVCEMITAFVRAGSNAIITYYAREISCWLKEGLLSQRINLQSVTE